MDVDRHTRRKCYLSTINKSALYVLIDKPTTAFQVNFVLRPLRTTNLNSFLQQDLLLRAVFFIDG